MSAIHVPLSQRRLLAAALAAVLAVVLGVRYLGGHADAAPAVAPVRVAAPAASTPTKEVVVDVVGAVRRPGLYRLRQGDRIADAVACAGGLAWTADPVALNLAAPLGDGQQVVVPARVRGAPAGVASAAAPRSGTPSPSAPVDLNSATVEQLDVLPGVGPVTAQKIVDYRQEHGPFTATAELDAIPGIGPARLHDLEGLVTP